MATTTRSDIPGYDVVRQLDDRRNPVFEVRRMPSEDVFVAKTIGPEYEPHLPGQRSKTARRLGRVLSTSVGWVPVEDHGTAADGHSFVIMPLYQRGSLADRLDGNAEPWADAVRWITGAALSIGNLHDEGISLDFLRPSTILLSNDDEPHVAVYGLATRRFDDGTFRFEAPEVVAGKRSTPASDTYSLALILTTLLIGRTPEFGESLGEYVSRLDETCPESIKAVIAKSLDESPSARHGDGTDFAHSLRASSPVDQPPDVATTIQITEDDLRIAGQRRQSFDSVEPAPTATNASDDVFEAGPPPVAPVGSDDGFFDDVISLATVTAPVPTAASTPGLPQSKVSGEEQAPTLPAQSISAQEALDELEDLIWRAPEVGLDEAPPPVSPANPADISGDSGQRGEHNLDQGSTNESPNPSDALTELDTSSTEHDEDQPARSAGDGVPFKPRPATSPGGGATSNRLQAIALRIESFWYANRRSVATLFAASAVAGIAGIAALLAFQSYQDERVSIVEGAPAPTTVQVVVADLNNEIAFVTEPPQTNTTTTTRPPRRRTTTTTEAAPTKTTADDASGGDDKKKKDEEDPADDPAPDNEPEPDDDDDPPPATEAPKTIPEDVEEEQEGRRGRGRNP